MLRQEIKRLFKEADTDGSNSVDWREFLSWIINGTAMRGMGAKGAASFERLLNTETQDEASFVESAQMGHNVTEYLKRNGSKGKSRTRKKTTTKAGCDEFGVPADYSGYRIQWPMTPQGAKDLLDNFLHNGSNKPLHAKHVQLILDEFVAAYKDRHPKPVIETEVPQPDGRLVIVGDTHGQLADVLHILYHLGPPSANNRYLFNGDMVDRGNQGVEILLILFSFFLADNESIIVHRGNHENEEDCLTRVKNLTIDYINTLPFQDYTAPHPLSTNVKDFRPVEYQNRLRFLVRSHQVPEDGRGFQKQHNDRCVTVFSASNYCGDGGNFGAVIVLSASNFPRYEVFEHFAAPLEEMPAIVAQGDATDWNQMSTSQQRESAESSKIARQEKTFERMIISIIEKKPQLWAFVLRQSVRKGIHYKQVTKFLNRWVVKSESAGYSSFVNDAIKQVYEAIVAMDMDLTETFKLFDKDGDGTVDLKEAKQVLEKFDLGLSSSQIDRLLGQLFSTSVITTADSARIILAILLGLTSIANGKGSGPTSTLIDSWTLPGSLKANSKLLGTSRHGGRVILLKAKAQAGSVPDPGWIQEALALKEIPKEGPNLQERNPQKMIAKERPETCLQIIRPAKLIEVLEVLADSTSDWGARVTDFDIFDASCQQQRLERSWPT
eukprot:g3836.t1